MNRGRWAVRALAVATSLALSCALAPGATALPEPRKEQWWFGPWDVTSKVWPVSTGKGVTVGLLDTGVNAKLPDLRGVIKRGGDTTGGKQDGRKDFGRTGHGTGMASLIASQGRGTGMAGLAPDAKILPVVIDRYDRDLHELTPIEKGIRYAVDHGAKVINMSLGEAAGLGPDNCAMQDDIDYAVKRDVLLVASAGNEPGEIKAPEEPGVCPGVVSVGATGRNQKPWKSTQPQPFVSVAAPGQAVGRLGKTGRFLPGRDGTSLSAALVSATAALIRSKYPNLSARQVAQRLMATAKDIHKPGKDDATGYGLIRPYEALTANVPANAPNPTFERWDKRQQHQKFGDPPAPKPVPIAESSDTEDGIEPRYIVGTIVALMAIAAVAVTFILIVRRRKPKVQADPGHIDAGRRE